MTLRGEGGLPVTRTGETLTRRHLVRSSLWLVILLVVSRLLGAALQIAVAALFGTSAEVDAYLVASSIPQLMTGLYASGATILLVPLLARSDREADSGALSATNTALTFLLVLVAVVTVPAALFAAPITSVLGYGFAPDTLALTADLFAWLMVFMALSAVGSIVMGVLNGRGSFVLPGIASVGQSLTWLAVLVLLVTPLGIRALVFGAIAGALVFIAIQLPGRGLRIPHGFRPSFHAEADTLRGFVAPVFVFGAIFAFGQVNVVSDRFFASMLAPGAVAILDYAGKVHSVLLNVLAYSLVTPAYTRMTADLADGDTALFGRTVTFTTRLLMLSAIPTVIVTTVMREPIIRVLLEHGAFTGADTAQAASALALMAPAQLATAFTLLFIYTLFALRDTRALLGLSALSMVANLAFDLLLFRPFGVSGIAIASSLAFVPALWFMAVYIGRRIEEFNWRRLGSLALRVTVASGLAGAVAVALFTLIAGSADTPFTTLVIGLAAAVIVSVVVYFGLLRLFRVDEAGRLREVFASQVRRTEES